MPLVSHFFCGVKPYIADYVFLFIHLEFLPNSGFSLVDGTYTLLGYYTYFFRGKLGTQQTT